ncbi:transporter substrate-binding domain-containing protein [Pseudoalteromonas sp. SWN29]|uniref:substrate-binding periplasmic protein n=1 Tax=Pseudoalteromonas sp. SWN29 TaxID=2792064 RepID=UPI0018CE0259|nr:ABC transporter substrate-binding protein [Pseudoalteromonas sp. SWN29]MBH0029048.1 transporter substrate-binding domain-containing protein [Pseudoalteromonas sp. SWN29]
MNKIITIFLCVLFTAQINAFACDRTFSVASHDAFWPPYVIGMSNVFKGTEVRHGRIDLGWAGSYTEKRAKYAHYTVSYRTEVMRLYENKNNTHVVKSLADIFDQGLTIGANFGSYYGEEFEQYKTTHKKQIEYTSATSKRFEMLNKQRIDFAIEDELVGAYFAKENSNIKLVTNIEYVNKDDIYLMFSKKTVSINELKIINKHIKNNEAALKAIFE